jgi:SAM-dependent methyltransferase
MMTNQKEYFDRLAEVSGEVWWGNKTYAGIRRSQRRSKIVVRETGRFSDPKVLELGCGVGTFSRMMLTESPRLRLVSCDISPKAIEAAAARCAQFPNVLFQVADAAAMPFAAGAFDAVIGNSILHHLDLVKTLKECHRILKPGGILWFSEPNMMNPQIALEKNIRWFGRLLENAEGETAFFRSRLSASIRKAGFIDVSVEPFDFLHPLVPKALTGFFEALGCFLEKVPVVKEIAGSLMVRAQKPSSITQEIHRRENES